MNVVKGNNPLHNGIYAIWVTRYHYERTPARGFPVLSYARCKDGEWYYLDGDKTIKYREVIGAYLGPLPEFQVDDGKLVEVDSKPDPVFDDDDDIFN